jgi:tribbles-like protein
MSSITTNTSSSSSSQAPHHQSSAKHRDLQLLTLASSSSPNSNPSTPHQQSVDTSGPLTPDTVVLVNPFVALSSTTTTTTSINPTTPPLLTQTLSPTIRIVGEYELSETKFDDFKCARHVPTGEALLYKEFSLATIRQRLEPYQRLRSILLASLTNHQLPLSNKFSIEQLAAKYHLHFFRDVIPLTTTTALVIYPNYLSNLHTHITEKHRLNEHECRNLFTQIIRAVQMCHQVGLIVRDLKLRKIIFQDNHHTHLLLTGLDEAIMLQNPFTTDDFVASRFSCPVYACPEIVLNRQMYSGKMADSWSLGIILYTMLFGRYPFCDRTLVGLFIKIGRCRPDIPRTISLKARSLLRSLIRVKPDERLLAQDLLGHVWFGNDRDLSTNSMHISTTITTTTTTPNTIDETTNTINCLTNNSDLASKEDAVVPNFECE